LDRIEGFLVGIVVISNYSLLIIHFLNRKECKGCLKFTKVLLVNQVPSPDRRENPFLPAFTSSVRQGSGGRKDWNDSGK
jgi:hypothetical protein